MSPAAQRACSVVYVGIGSVADAVLCRFSAPSSRCHEHDRTITISPISFSRRPHIPNNDDVCLKLPSVSSTTDQGPSVGRAGLQGEPTIYHANGLKGQQQETKPPLLHI